MTSNKKSLLGLAISTALLATNANAADFYFGADDDIMLTINSQLSIGASWRLDKQDPRYISTTNGGTGATMTTDDGNLNFEDGDTFSKIIKGSHELQLSKDDFGAFVRFKYWYDKELKDESRYHGHSANGYQSGVPLNDDGFSDFSKFSGIELLDAYVYGSFELGESLLDLRVGRQVLSWGESTFIQGGMNSTNPFDVSALRRPGADLKEGILPVGMIYGNLGVTENLSLEAFYQYEWAKFEIDACGTLFQGADFAADGCNYIQVGSTPEKLAFDLGVHAERQADIEPDDGGQYGLAMRYFSPELNDTEFGLYYMNIHSRVPLINSIRGGVSATGVTDPDTGAPIVFMPRGLDPTGGSLADLNPGYLIEFPEDLKFYGASFATNVAGLALSGEISYKPDTPIQINGPEILNSVLSESPAFRYAERVLPAAPGEVVRGWDEFDVTQIQVTALQFFERVMGAARLTVIGEAGVILTDSVEDSNQRYGRNAVFGLGDFEVLPGVSCELMRDGLKAIAGDCADDGYVTDSSWGYRLRAIWEYPDVIAGISFKPTLAWSHDVSGYSPEPAQQFHEDKKVLGLSLEASYLQKYSATVGYSQFTGGSHNVLTDKDFVSLSFAVSY